MAKRVVKLSLINIDSSAVSQTAILEYNKDNNTRIKGRLCKYLNNIVEADHRFLKVRCASDGLW